MTMVRLFLSSLLLITDCLASGHAARPVQAFVPPIRTERSLARNNIQSNDIAANRRQRIRQLSLDTSSLKASSSDDNPDTTPTVNTKYLFPLSAIIALSLTTLAAYNQLLPGPIIDATAPPPFFATLPFGVVFSGSCGPYTPSLINRDLGATILSILGAGVFVKGITLPAKNGWLESRDSRKIIHTLSAPLFILLWPTFSNAYGARIFASIVPLLNAVRLYLAGSGGGGDGKQSSESELADAISRSGDASEALGGPFIYVWVLFFSILFFWTDSPVGVVAVANMAIGDGLADIVGRRLGSDNKWAFNSSKSMAGSAAFVAGSFAGSYGLISWLTRFGAMDALDMGPVGLAGRLLAIAVICAAIELLDFVDDNWSVPLSAAALSALLLN